MLMKEQNKLKKDYERSAACQQEDSVDEDAPVEPCKIEANGYIDYKVNFVASLSEADSNSWCDEASENSEDANPEDGYYDEEDDRKKDCDTLDNN